MRINHYLDLSQLPVIIPINIHIGTTEDFWRQHVKPELNNDRMKSVYIYINLLGYHIDIQVPYKHVGRTYYGRYIKDKELDI